MGWFTRERLALGLEMDPSGVRAVLLGQRGGRAVVRQTLCLDRLSEGFLDEAEMRQAFREWLEEEGLAGCPAACGLPQPMALEAVYDFPPEVRRGSLRRMVDFQTRSLCGISEETFLCGDQKLSSGEDGRSRILIAASREQVVDQCYARLRETGVNVRMMVEDGQALANAFVGLHPEEFRRPGLQMLLNVGKASSTIVLVRGGSLQYIAGIHAGGELFSRVLMQYLQCDEYQAEKEMRTFEADWTNVKSPFHRALRGFVNELESVLDHWRRSCPGGGAAADDGAGGPRLEGLWLTGVGALQSGFAERLGELLLCPVACFGGPRRPKQAVGLGAPDTPGFQPHLTIAFGLALQALGKGAFTISLLPRALQRRLRRIRDFPFVCGGVACLAAALLTAVAAGTASLDGRIRALERRRDDLRRCRRLVPEIERSQRYLRTAYRRMTPLLEYGRRSHLFGEALVNCRRVFREPGQDRLTAWGIYLADEFTFVAEHGLPPGSPAAADPAPAPRRKDAAFPAAPAAPERPPFLPVDDVPRLRKMYLGGITEQNESRFETLKKIQANFASERLFANVDDYTDFYQGRFPGGDPGSWRSFLAGQRSQLTSEFTVFLLQLPFQEKPSDE